MDEKILVTRSSMPELEEYIDEIRELWDTHWLTNMGTKHNELNRQLKEYLCVNDISLFCNGHMGLELTIQAMEFPPGSEVITTPFTFASTTHAIVRNNLVPVFCDIREDDYTIDTSKIEKLITKKTVAILPVHVYGHICDVEEIETIADVYGLKVIYDAAHAFGETYKGIGIGNFGDASLFSFHATKVFNTIEGGGVTYKNQELGKRLYQLKNFGIQNEEVVDGIGANGKMNEFAAAMGICNLRHISCEIEKRKIIYDRYISNLKKVDGLKLPSLKEDIKYNYAYFPIFVEPTVYGYTRDELCDELLKRGIHARKYFYPLTSEFECYKGMYNVDMTPTAYETSLCILTLPMYADLLLQQVDDICQIISEKRER